MSTMACDDLDREFFTGTTMHGIGRIVQRSRLVFKLLWLLIVSTLSGVCVWQITDRVVRFAEFNVNTEITLEFTSAIEFPAVTICNFNKYYASRLSENDEVLIYNLINVIHGADIDLNSTLSPGFDYANFTRRVSMQLDDSTLLHCEWRGKACSAKNFTHIFTSYGNCYTFNGGNDGYIIQDQPGPGNGLKILIDIHQAEYMPSSGDNIQAGIKVLVHDKQTPPLMDARGKAVPPGAYAFVALQQVRSISLPKPYGPCVVESTLEHFEKYSMIACLIEWRLGIIVEQCGCKPFEYPGTARDCTLVETTVCVRDTLEQIKRGDFMQSGCSVSCNTTTFSTDVSLAQFPNAYFANVMAGMLPKYTREYALDSMVFLDIFYDEINYEEMRQTAAMTTSALVSDIGGQVGFFLGASVITMCEFVEYFIMKCHRLLGRKKVGIKHSGNVESGIHREGPTILVVQPKHELY